MAISLTGLRKTFLSPAFILRSLPVGVVIAVGVLASIWTHALLNNHEALVSHTYQVIDTTKDVLIALDDAETGERGYVISGDIKRLEPYEKALGRLAQLRLDLASRISDNPEQRARVESLNDLIDQKLAELKQSIKTRGNGDSEASQELEVAIMQAGSCNNAKSHHGHHPPGHWPHHRCREIPLNDSPIKSRNRRISRETCGHHHRAALVPSSRRYRNLSGE